MDSKNTIRAAQAAEARIRNMRRAREKAIQAAMARWDDKLEAYIERLPVDVRHGLRAFGVIEHFVDEEAPTREEA